MTYVPDQFYSSEQEQELENLRKQIKELEIELKGQRCRRDREGSFDDPNYTGGGTRESSHCSSSRRSRDRSHETMRHRHDSPHQDKFGHHNVALDAMSCALKRVTRSPFSDKIERIEMLRRFSRSPFTCYDSKTNPVEHVSHYIQMMLFYSQNNG